MYLGTALKLAIPFAILDREDLSRVYDHEGSAAEEADKACEDLRALLGVKTQAFTAAQRQTARLALWWAEQYLYGYLDALDKSSYADEIRVSKKQMLQIRKVRLQHFGHTDIEVFAQRATPVPIGGDDHHLGLIKLLGNTVVVCPTCKTTTNMRSAGEKCNNCQTGTFQTYSATNG